MLHRLEGPVHGQTRALAKPQWVLSARTRQTRHRVISATAALKSAAAAAAAVASYSNEASTSAPSSPHVHRYQSSYQMPEDWDYKYNRFPCASPVQPGDVRCQQIEALFQHVLGYPRLPPRVHRHLQTSNASVEMVTATVEGLTAKYGKELAFHLIRRCPQILDGTFDGAMEKADVTRSMLDLKPHEIFMILRKNPMLLVMDSSETRARYNKLHKVTPLSHEAVKVMVRKYPLVLNSLPETIAAVTEKLRHLAYTRAMWQQDFDCISPSLMAFFLRDYQELLLRIEYLALTGDSATWTLYQVFKPSFNLFARKHRGFREWLNMRAARRQQLMRRAQLASQRSDEQRGKERTGY